jgi:hypothetical protein
VNGRGGECDADETPGNSKERDLENVGREHLRR